MMADADEQVPPTLDVLLVVDEDVRARFGSVVRHLCVGMMDEAVRLVVLSPAPRGEGYPDGAIGPSPVITAQPRRWPWQHARADEALDWIGGHRPDVVHCASSDLARWVQRWASAWHADLLVHLTDLVDIQRFGRLGQDASTVALVTNDDVRRALLDGHPAMRERVHMVPLGIPAATEPACLARPERVPAALVTAELTQACGLDVVLKALRLILDGGGDVQLFVLGSGPAERLFRNQVRALGLWSHVTFASGLRGWAALRDAMQGADFYIVPGAGRRFTAGPLTAMATGLAVLAPEGRAEPYLIAGETASLFSPGSASDLAERWSALVGDRSAARDLAQRALDYMRAHHQASAMVAATAGVYRELCGFVPAEAGR